MKTEYIKWMFDYQQRTPHLLGKCKEACTEMKESFPELVIVKGHVFCAWGQRGHRWLVDEEGTILDPTAEQFPCIFTYEEWQPGTPVRVGKCMECGDEIWEPLKSLDADPGHRTVCSEACERALLESLR